MARTLLLLQAGLAMSAAFAPHPKPLPGRVGMRPVSSPLQVLCRAAASCKAHHEVVCPRRADYRISHDTRLVSNYHVISRNSGFEQACRGRMISRPIPAKPTLRERLLRKIGAGAPLLLHCGALSCAKRWYLMQKVLLQS